MLNSLRPLATRSLVSAASRRSLASSAVVGGKGKVSTGIVGLPVDPQARQNLIELYNQTLKDVEGLKLEIRRDIIAITKYRLGVVEKLNDPEEIEKEIKCGQIEELVQQARDELGLVRWLISNAQDKHVAKKDKERKSLLT